MPVELDYVIPADGNEAIQALYEEVPNADPKYAELIPNSQDDRNAGSATYQGLLRRDSDYVIPAVQEPSNEQV